MAGLLSLCASCLLFHLAVASSMATEPTDVSTAALAIQIKQMMEKIDMVTGGNGTSAGVRDAVEGMMVEFRTLNLNKFKAAFARTQADIRSNVATFEALNKKAVAAKDSADARNKALSSCRGEEKSLLEVHEKCAVDGHWANKSWTEACQAADDAQVHDWAISKELTKKHRCDLSQEDCVKLESLSDEVDRHYEEATKKRNVFNAKTKECSAAKDASLAKESECQKKLDTFRHKRALCDQAEFDLKMSACAFGESLQAKCGQYETLTNLVSKVQDGHDTEYSEADRKENWLKGHALQCMLKSYTSGGSIDDSVRNLCESQSDYEKEVGTMDYESQKIMDCVRPSPPMFSCNESSVLFAGSVWTTGNESAKYSEEDASAANVSLTLGAGSFSWCQAKEKRGNCRGFVCADPWKPKPDMASIKCTLTECSEYECCLGSAPSSAATPAQQLDAPIAKAPAAAPEAASAPVAAAPVAAAPEAAAAAPEAAAAAPAPVAEEGLLATTKAKMAVRPVAKKAVPVTGPAKKAARPKAEKAATVQRH